MKIPTKFLKTILLLTTLLFPANVFAENEIGIAIVQDGASEILNEYSSKVQKNINILAKDSLYSVSFKNFISSSWSANEISNLLIKALNDPEVDYIFANGPIVNRIALKEGLDLTKPVISNILQKTDLVSYKKKKNFSSLRSPQTFERELEVFSNLVEFELVHVIIDHKFHEIETQLQTKIDEFNLKSNQKVELLSYKESTKELIKSIDKEKNIQAIYLAPLSRMPQAERLDLINFINKKKIPSFSGLGLQDLEHGVLMTITPDLTERISRRIALNVHQLLVLDTKLEEISPFIPINEKLSINGKTAKEIAYYPDFKTEISANILHKEDLKIINNEKADLNLDAAILLARKKNIDLTISSAQVDESKARKKRALSGMLPQASLNGRFSSIDDNRAKASNGRVPKSSTSLGVGLSQMIFDDQVITDFREARKNFQSQEFLYDLSAFDVMADAGAKFLQYASDIELLKIEIENLNLVQSNLDLAQNRFHVGRAGKEEIYRWQSEKAKSQTKVLRQEALTNQSLIFLNQALNVDQDTQWNIKNDINVTDYGPLKNELSSRIKNRKDFEVFKEFLVKKSFEFSPELRSLEKNIEAQKLRINRLRRRFFLPTVYTDLSYQKALQQNREGAFAEINEDANENTFSFSINAEYSIFEGGGKFFDIEREKASLARLEGQKTRAIQLIERETLATIFAIRSSAPSIFLTRVSSENAKKNLEVIRDKYARGAIDIITLLDAQNNALTQRQTAAIAEFDYLGDVVSLQRAISWFQSTSSKDQEKKMMESFIKYRNEEKDED